MNLKYTIKKKKPKWLKTTFWKQKLISYLLNIFYIPKKSNSSECNGILVTSTDGLGDTFLRLPLLKEWQRKNPNIWVLSQKVSAPIFETCGFNVIIYNSKLRTNIIKRIKLIKKLNALPIKDIYVGEFFRNENLINYLKGNKIGLENPLITDRNNDLDELITTESYTGDSLKNYAKATSSDIDVSDNRKHLPKEGNLNKNQIIIAIGAQDKNRMMRVSNMIRIIQLIIQTDDCQILLIGAGKKEQIYANKIKKHLKTILNVKESSRISYRIDKLSLFEIIQEIYQSKLLIGFDSGMYNLSYTLHQPTLCIAAKNERVLHRNASWVRIVRNANAPSYGIDDGYGDSITNAVNLNEFIKVYKELCKLN